MIDLWLWLCSLLINLIALFLKNLLFALETWGGKHKNDPGAHEDVKSLFLEFYVSELPQNSTDPILYCKLELRAPELRADPVDLWPVTQHARQATGPHLADLLYGVCFGDISMSVCSQRRTFPCMSEISYRGLTLQTRLDEVDGEAVESMRTLTLMSDVTGNLCHHRLRPGTDRLNSSCELISIFWLLIWRERVKHRFLTEWKTRVILEREWYAFFTKYEPECPKMAADCVHCKMRSPFFWQCWVGLLLILLKSVSETGKYF